MSIKGRPAGWFEAAIRRGDLTAALSEHMPLSILVAVANRPELREELAGQLTADGHDVHHAHQSRHATALLDTAHPLVCEHVFV